MKRGAPETTPVPRPVDQRDEYFPKPRQLFVILAVYFALQVISRLCFSSSVDLDESEAVVLAQQFSLGYGQQPPLYTWLQMGVFDLVGESILGLSLLKNLLLFGTFSLTFAAAKIATRSARAAVVACLSLFFLPTIAWESQRDLTHSVLASTFSVGTLLALVQIHAKRQTSWYVAFGCCAGLGLLSKFNFALWVAGLLLAGMSLADFRRSILDLRIVVAAGLAFAIFLPVGWWMIENRHLVLLSAGKLQLQPTLPALASAQVGLRKILQSVLSVVGPLMIIYALVFYTGRKNAGPAEAALDRPGLKLMLRAWVWIAAILFLLVIIAKATGFRERWFQPILVTLPIFAAGFIRNRLTPMRLKFVFGLALTVMVSVAVVLPGRLFIAERLRREEPLTRPYADLAGQMRPHIPAGALLVCDTKLLAGNLRLNLPDVRVSTPELTHLFKANEQHCFLVWDARQTADVPELLKTWAKANGLTNAISGEPRHLEAVYRYHRTKVFRIGLLAAR